MASPNRTSLILGLWARAMLHYREPEGERALTRLGKLIGDDAVAALMFIVGFASSFTISPSGVREAKLRELANLCPPDQDYFWSDEWQKMEKEADRDLKTGAYRDFKDVKDLIEDLHHADD